MELDDDAEPKAWLILVTLSLFAVLFLFSLANFWVLFVFRRSVHFMDEVKKIQLNACPTYPKTTFM